MKGIVSVIVAGLVAGAAAAPAAAQTNAAMRAAADQQRQSRYQISQMERMLEGAVEHGLTVVREKLQAAVKAQTFIVDNPENAHVRGFRLDGYGVFFDIEVPPLQGSLIWSLRTLDQNDLGLASAIRVLREHVNAEGDPSVQQALKRLELQVAPSPVTPLAPNVITLPPSGTPARNATGAPATVSERVEAAPAAAMPDPPDPILRDPEEGYRTEVKNQIMDAMLEYSPLRIGADEWLTVGVRGHNDRPVIAPADSDSRTVVIRIRGGDLTAFRANQLTRDEALKKMIVQMF